MSDNEFVGARLELARSFHHLTLKKLAEAVSASHSVLGHYENGLRKPADGGIVAALASALSVTPRFFFEPLTDVWQETDCSFRRRVATPEGLKKRARAHGTMIGLVVRELTTKIKFPAYNVPNIAARSEDEIEAAAEACRVQWKLGFGPIEHIGRIAELNGVVLVQHLRHTDEIDAFSRRGPFSVIVLNTARTSTSRLIFDVAHELGHFVLHRGVETGSRETEEQANQFASALLLPRKTFARELRAKPFSWTHAFDLKRRWMTSVSAIIRRAYSLSVLDAITYRRCYQHMSMQGWLKREPYEPDFVPPEWLASAFALAEKRFQLTPSVLCERLHLLPQTFESITGIPVQTVQPARFRPKLIKAGP
jgi:Zn-dependent peptidase ImmA (M78 family)/transcriptional regulator with XRE-family HTH domain